jgi:hypothetical protein
MDFVRNIGRSAWEYLRLGLLVGIASGVLFAITDYGRLDGYAAVLLVQLTAVLLLLTMQYRTAAADGLVPEIDWLRRSRSLSVPFTLGAVLIGVVVAVLLVPGVPLGREDRAVQRAVQARPIPESSPVKSRPRLPVGKSAKSLPPPPLRSDEKVRELRRHAAIKEKMERVRLLTDAGQHEAALSLLEEIDREIAKNAEIPSWLKAELLDLRRDALARAKMDTPSYGPQLNEIETAIEQGRFPEAITLAKRLIENPTTPEPVSVRAKALRRQAELELAAAFEGQVTATKSNVGDKGKASRNPPR